MTKQISSVITGSFRGMTTKRVVENIPIQWNIFPALRGIGWKLVDENDVERVRFMKKSTKFPEKYPNGYWVRKNQNNEFLDVDGNAISKDMDEELRLERGHIPYTGEEENLAGFDLLN